MIANTAHRLAGLALLLVATLVAAPAGAAPRVKLGIDVLLDSRIDLVAGKRVGVVTNPSGVDGALIPTVDRLAADKRVKLKQIWAPEHGIRGALANGDSGGSFVDPETGVPVEGLFGKRSEPSKKALKRVDVILFDIQDIGSRTYTYVTTLGKVMTAAGRAKVPVIVLDRPNPHGGLVYEGAIRIKKYKSLIGWAPIPVTHGMTIGELAQFYNAELGLNCDLTVVEMEGWQRWMRWEDTGLQWVPTSPGIPHTLNAYMYVATGMVGGAGSNINEGGGNSQPFELMGAPFFDPKKLAKALNAEGVDGVYFRPMSYRPHYGRRTGSLLHGVQLILTDPRAFRPLRTAMVLLTTMQRLYPNDFEVKNEKLFGRVWGNDEILKMLRKGRSWKKIEASWQKELAAFGLVRAKHLIYPEGMIPPP